VSKLYYLAWPYLFSALKTPVVVASPAFRG
jgi:hypothetical protein